MPGAYDFERAWLDKLARSLERVAGQTAKSWVMEGSESLSAKSSSQETITWSKGAMERLDALVDESQSREIMAGCACQYPKADLQKMREVYAETGDLDRVHQMLQAQFESFLVEVLELDAAMVGEIVSRGWGAAGVRQGNAIIATKIPKSGFLVEYMQETDAEKRRQYYCHCPRVRDVLKTSETLSSTYCYCGAGFYKGIWEEILQEPVEVELLESLLAGDDVCKIAIHLPLDDQRPGSPA